MSRNHDNFADLITFTRASTATFVGSNGLIQSATTNTPRIDFDPVTKDRKGLLIEESRTNLTTQSESFSNFALRDVTLTQNATTAPDGTNNAVKIVENSDNDDHYIHATITITSGATCTLSAFLKQSESNRHGYLRTGSEGTTTYIVVDLSNGTVSETGSDVTSSSVQNFGNGWYRASFTYTNAGDTASGIIIGISNSTTPSSDFPVYTGDGSSGIFVFGAQFEEGAFPTSYIPTSGSTATRAADAASIATSAFGYNQDEGTLVTEAQTFLANNSHRILSINDGSSSNQIILMAHTTNHLFVKVGGATQGFCDAGFYDPNVFRKHAAAYQEDHFAACIDAGTVATDSSGTVPTVNVMNIGSALLSSFGFLNGHIKKLQYFPRRLSDTQLQEITR
tara:strand:- start:13 stop:1194 length:1182 start_codon:yes stop_codon:yes gene_type:complete